MTAQRADVVVIGAGLAGASAAWHLASSNPAISNPASSNHASFSPAGSGRDVVLLEQFAPGHDHGSSHGSSRIFRRAYADPFYVQLTGAAEPWWQQLEAQSGQQLRTFTGGLDTGTKRSTADLQQTLVSAGVAAQLLAPEEVAERWSGLHVQEPACFHPDAGWLNADLTLAAMVSLAQAAGAQLATGVVVDQLVPGGNGITVHARTGESWHAQHVVLCTGGWLPEQLPALLQDLGVGRAQVPLPQFTVKQQEIFHFRQQDPAVRYPTVVHKGLAEAGDGEFYTLPSGSDGGPGPAMKIGQFDSAVTTTASSRDKLIDPRARQAVQTYRQRHFPGLEPQPTAEMSCLFTMTGDEDFLLDAVPVGEGSLTVASPCSGHGAKFAPLIGRLITDLIEGASAVPRFAFRQ